MVWYEVNSFVHIVTLVVGDIGLGVRGEESRGGYVVEGFFMIAI